MAQKRVDRIKVWIGRTRPAYDSAPFGECDLTDSEARTLRNTVGRYLRKCEVRRGNEGRKVQRYG